MLMKRINAFLFLIVFAIIASPIVHSCGYSSDCFDSKPEQGEIKVKLTIDDTNDTVIVKIYQGVIENNKLLIEDTLTIASKTYNLPVNSYYSASAEYNHEGKLIRAVDGDRISVSESEDDYGYVCWNLRNIVLDLRLKK